MNALDFTKYFKGELFDNPASQAALENSSNTSYEYGSLILSAMIPFMAIISVIVFFDKKYNLTEHVIVYLYSMSALTILSVIVGQIVLLFIPNSYLIFVLLLYLTMFVYHCYAFKRIFKMGIGDLILRIFLFFIVFIAFYIIVGIIVAIFMFFNGDFQQIIEAQKAAQGA